MTGMKFLRFLKGVPKNVKLQQLCSMPIQGKTEQIKLPHPFENISTSNIYKYLQIFYTKTLLRWILMFWCLHFSAVHTRFSLLRSIWKKTTLMEKNSWKLASWIWYVFLTSFLMSSPTWSCHRLKTVFQMWDKLKNEGIHDRLIKKPDFSKNIFGAWTDWVVVWYIV